MQYHGKFFFKRLSGFSVWLFRTFFYEIINFMLIGISETYLVYFISGILINQHWLMVIALERNYVRICMNLRNGLCGTDA